MSATATATSRATLAVVTHAGDDEALEVANRSQLEVDFYRRSPKHFGYGFFVMQRT